MTLRKNPEKKQWFILRMSASPMDSWQEEGQFCKGERERERKREEGEREERVEREDMRESESEVIMELVEGWFMSVQLPLMSLKS